MISETIDPSDNTGSASEQKKSTSKDREVETMAKIAKLLRDLSPEENRRVVKWLRDRYANEEQ